VTPRIQERLPFAPAVPVSRFAIAPQPLDLWAQPGRRSNARRPRQTAAGAAGGRQVKRQTGSRSPSATTTRTPVAAWGTLTLQATEAIIAPLQAVTVVRRTKKRVPDRNHSRGHSHSTNPRSAPTAGRGRAEQHAQGLRSPRHPNWRLEKPQGNRNHPAASTPPASRGTGHATTSTPLDKATAR